MATKRQKRLLKNGTKVVVDHLHHCATAEGWHRYVDLFRLRACYSYIAQEFLLSSVVKPCRRHLPDARRPKLSNALGILSSAARAEEASLATSLERRKDAVSAP